LEVRVKYLLKPDAAGFKVAAPTSLFDLRSSTLTPALSRRERVIYTSRCRLMPKAPLPSGEEATIDLVFESRPLNLGDARPVFLVRGWFL